MAPATRWAICSAGKISHDFVVALRTLPADEHEVVAVAARDKERAQEFATRHGIARAYGSYEELAADPDMDVVYVGAIHPQHSPLTLMMLRAGKNVMCEKPLTMTLAQTKELTATARSTRRFLMEAFWSRFFPAYDEVRAALAEGQVGEVQVVRTEFGVRMLNVRRVVEPELGGGALLDIGCYCLQFISMAFGAERPLSIHASGFLNASGVDETVTVVLKYSRKRMGIFTCSSAYKLANEACIFGTKGSIKIPDTMWSPSKVIINGEEKEYVLPPPSIPLNFITSTGMRYEAAEVRRCLLQGLTESRVMPLEESELLAGIMDEILQQLAAV